MSTVAWAFDSPSQGRRVLAIHDTTVLMAAEGSKEFTVYQWAHDTRSEAERHCTGFAANADIRGTRVVATDVIGLSQSALALVNPTRAGKAWSVPVLFGELMTVLP